jgi:hypothetical protein
MLFKNSISGPTKTVFFKFYFDIHIDNARGYRYGTVSLSFFERYRTVIKSGSAIQELLPEPLSQVKVKIPIFSVPAG